eukprot:jgi/Chlat1/902/Chrsp107S01327
MAAAAAAVLSVSSQPCRSAVSISRPLTRAAATSTRPAAVSAAPRPSLVLGASAFKPLQRNSRRGLVVVAAAASDAAASDTDIIVKWTEELTVIEDDIEKTIKEAKALGEGPAAANEWDRVEELCAEAAHKRTLIKEKTERRLKAKAPTYEVDPATVSRWLADLENITGRIERTIAKAKAAEGAAAVNEWDRVEELRAEASHKRELIKEATTKY